MRCEINYIGLKVEAFKISYEFYRKCYKNGKPRTMVLGGIVQVKLQANSETMRFLEEVLTIDERHKNLDLQSPTDSESYKRATFKFYNNDDYNIRALELLDSYISDFKEVFETVQNHLKNKETNNHVKLKFKSASQIINKGVTKNVFGWWMTNPFTKEEYQSPVQAVENTDEFYLSIKHLTDKKTLVPLGIPAFNGTTENKNIEFEIEVTENDIDSFDIEILKDGNVIYTIKSGEEGLPKNYKVGKHPFKWDGFDSNGIYDSTLFTTGKLKARIKGKRNGKEKTAESSEFAFEYKEVNWVDTKINKNAKRIDVTLRVNLKDGGEKGTEEDCRETGSGSYAPITKHCPWDKIPEKDIKRNGKTPIQKRDKNNNSEALKQLALDGIKKYWSRHTGNIGKGVFINKELYEVYISCKQDEQGMIAPEIIYFTNSENGMFNRSHNWFASRKLFYKEGYLKSDRWDYRSSSVAIKYFEETTAHEIGHQLLVQLDGKYNSYTHKGTSHWSVIKQDPIKGTKYPTGGKEIDLMKYADDSYPYDYYKRVILSEKDLLGLLWLTKLELN